MSQFFPAFSRKLAPTKTEKITDKAIKHNRGAVFLQALVLLGNQQEWCQLCLIVHSLFITLPQNLRQLPFSPPPPSVCSPLGVGRHARYYNNLSPELLTGTPHNNAPAASDLSVYHNALRYAYVIKIAASNKYLHPNFDFFLPADAK